MRKNNYKIYLYNRYEPNIKIKYQVIAIVKSKGLAFIFFEKLKEIYKEEQGYKLTIE